MSRVPIYLITFFTYAAIHMMRITYSFNKHDFQVVFGVSYLFLGILDAIIYLTLSIGTFSRYSIINSLKPVQGCFYTAFPVAIGFALIPAVAFYYQNTPNQGKATYVTYIVFIIAAVMFGFFQLNFFPAMLTIFGHSFNIKNDGRIVGIWSAKSNSGNILGFLISNLLVYQFNVKWQATMLICSCFLIVMVILLRTQISNPDFKEQPQIKSGQFFAYFKKTWQHNQFKLYILTFSFFMAVLYSYELWTPKFLVEVGYKDYSGYVPMVFDCSTLFGSFVMGHLYKTQHNTDTTKQDATSKAILLLTKYKFFVPGVIVVVVSLLYIVVPGSLAIYFVFGSLMGLFLGAIYNSLQNSEVLNYTHGESSKTDMFATINIGIGAATVGLSQFIIGLSLDLGSDSSSETNLVKKGLIYLVIGCIAIIATTLAFLRTCHKKAVPEMTYGEKTENLQLRDEMVDQSQLGKDEINQSIEDKSQYNQKENEMK